MSGLDDLLGSALGGNALTAIAARAGIPASGAQQALGAALPSLLGQLKANADDPQKSAALQHAIDNDHDGAVLDDVHGFLGNDANEAAGSKILGHVFGDASGGEAAKAVALKGGIDQGQATKLLAMLAPLVLGALGRAKKQGGGNAGGGGLSDLLGGVLGGGGGALGGLLGGLLGGGGGALGSVLGGSGGSAGGGIGDVLSDVLGGGSTGSASSGKQSRKGGALGKILGGLLKRR